MSEGGKNRWIFPHFGSAWLILCLSLGIHVLDEAANDFLDFYNPKILRLRETYPWLVLPTFSFPMWIALLALAVTVLLLFTPHAYREAWGMVPMATGFSIVMFLNAIAHLAVALYSGKPVAGLYTSPLLLAASIYLFLVIPWHKVSKGKESETAN